MRKFIQIGRIMVNIDHIISITIVKTETNPDESLVRVQLDNQDHLIVKQNQLPGGSLEALYIQLEGV